MIVRAVQGRVSTRALAGFLSTTMLSGAAALIPGTAFAACAVSGSTDVTCGSTATTATVFPANTPNDNAYSFNTNVTGSVTSGSTISGNGLQLTSTAVNGSVSFTNSGTITAGGIGFITQLTGNGGGVTYMGNGNITATAGNANALVISDNGGGTGAITVNATGGAFRSWGNTVSGLQVFTSNTGGINITTSGGHSIELVNTFSGMSHRGMYINNNGATGDIIINSGTTFTTSSQMAGTNAGNINAIEINQVGTGNVSVTSNGVIDLSTGITGNTGGVVITSQGVTGNLTTNINANVSGVGGGVGVSHQFSNAASTGASNIMIAAGVTVNMGGTGIIVDGNAGNHLTTIGLGAGSSVSGTGGSGIRTNGANTNIALTNAGSIGGGAQEGVFTAGNISGINTGTISGATTGIATNVGGSNFINAGNITGLGGNAILFMGVGNTLTLRDGTNITGIVNGGTTATLQLGGTTGTPTFNASNIGAQYLNFTTFNKIDSGTWTLSGTGSQTWNVSGGTLSGTDASQGNVVLSNNSTFNFNTAGAGTYFSVISGAGSLTKDGTGNVTLFNAQTYTGATTINNGALSGNSINALPVTTALTIGTGGTAAAYNTMGFNQTVASLAGNAQGTLSLANGGVFTVGDATSTTYNGVLTSGAAGSFNKVGTGTLTLGGTSAAFSQATNVTAGTLSVNGSIANSAVNVAAAGTLGGTGTVGTTTITGGKLAPGNSIGTLNVNGNLTLNAAAAYLLEVNPTTSDRVNVTGVATLGGASVNATYAAGSYISKQYTIVNATGGVSGTFGTLTNTNLPANFTSSLSYDANNAYLNLVLNFAGGGGGGAGAPVFTPLNQNQRAVANALVSYFNRTGGIPTVFGTLSSSGLMQSDGETATGSQQTTFNAMNQFLGLITDPFITGRGDPIAGGGTPSAYADEAQALAYAGRSRPNDALGAIYTKAPRVVPFQPGWSTWVAGYGGSQKTEGNFTVGSNDTRSSIYGVAAGADYRFTPNTIAGFALAGGGTNFNVNLAGRGSSDLFQAGVFVRHTEGAAYITAAAAYGWQDVTTNRTVTIAGIDQLRANFDANAYSGRVETGYRFVAPFLGGFGLTPYAAGQVTVFDLPAYRETAVSGANTFALAYGSRSVTDTRSELGFRTDKSYAMDNGILTLRGRTAWAHDFNPNRAINATFLALPGAAFTVNGARQARDALLSSSAIEFKWASNWSVSGTFESEWSNVTRSYAGKGVIRYVW